MSQTENVISFLSLNVSLSCADVQYYFSNYQLVYHVICTCSNYCLVYHVICNFVTAVITRQCIMSFIAVIQL